MAFSSIKNKIRSRPLRIIFIFYWFLLAYILAALIFWYIDLNAQNQELTRLRLNAVNPHETNYVEKVNQIKDIRDRKKYPVRWRRNYFPFDDNRRSNLCIQNHQKTTGTG